MANMERKYAKQELRRCLEHLAWVKEHTQRVSEMFQENGQKHLLVSGVLPQEYVDILEAIETIHQGIDIMGTALVQLEESI